MKDATEFNELCQKVSSAKGDGTDYTRIGTGIKCKRCGHLLDMCCCGEHLFMVECDFCRTKAIVEARYWQDAIFKTLG